MMRHVRAKAPVLTDGWSSVGRIGNWVPANRHGSEVGMKAEKDDALLTPAEVAALFRVDPKTVTRWAKAGKLSSIRTLGGHRRYRAEEVKKFLEGATRQEG
jgi:excisionase family DNA binding protein